MMNPEDLDTGQPWALASLRIVSETLSTDEIGEMLGRRATSTRTSEGDPEFSVWMLESGLAPTAPVEDHIYILAEMLSDHTDAVRHLAENSTAEVWISFSPGMRHRSAVITSAVLSAIGSLGLDVVFDAYPAKMPRQ